MTHNLHIHIECLVNDRIFGLAISNPRVNGLHVENLAKY